MKERFTKRIGISLESKPIVVRYDAPTELRYFLSNLLLQLNPRTLKGLRQVVCATVMMSPDPSNWGENDYMKSEIQDLIAQCDWYRVYELIETAYERIIPVESRQEYEDIINEFFMANGIGWKMEKGEIMVRGEDSFERDISSAKELLSEAGLETSSGEIKEAIWDLSRVPDPDITGAVQHAGAALECVAREVAGSKDTLGALIKAHPEIVPAPINDVVSKLFGYASEKGRHLKEGILPSFEEAELLVHLSVSLCSYLTKKNFPIHPKETFDLSF